MTETLSVPAHPGVGRTLARILLVEDSPTQAMHTRLILEDAGWGVEVCGDGCAVIETAIRTVPDLILLDMHLPGMDGLEVAERLKANAFLADIPVVFLTGVFRDVQDIIGGLEQGADDYVLKTVSDDELVARVRACLRVRNLQRDLGRLARLLLAVNRIGTRLAGLLELDALLETACRLLHAELGYPSVSVFVNEAGAALGTLQPRASAGPRCARLRSSRAGLPGDVADDRVGGSRLEVQFRTGTSARGILVVSSTHAGAFDENDELALGAIGELLGAAIHGARLYEQMEEQATRDALTGLLCRRAILSRLDDEWSRSRRHGRPLSLISVDIDRFKSTNDQYGHATGDAAIRAVAQAITGAIRREDFAGRLGGDEFLIVLPETSSTGAMEVAERVRLAVASTVLSSTQNRALPIDLTSSLGAASWPETPAETPAILLHASDHALYQAKAAGRNRSCLAS